MQKKLKNFKLNFGPQHPSAHGVLRLSLKLNGELVKKVDPQIGFLHRGSEKLIENKTNFQSLPYFDRLDYVSVVSQEHAFSLCLEKILNLNISKRSQYLRVIISELTRILNHLMCLTTHALDIGALSPFLWLFEEREKIMEFYERLSGARMHAIYFVPGGLEQDIPFGFCNDLFLFTEGFYSRISELEVFLSKNRIIKSRLENVGVVSFFDCLNYGFSGVVARASGTPHDLRKSNPYETYLNLNFYSICGNAGDCYDRFLLRLGELRQSLYIIQQCLLILPKGPIKENQVGSLNSIRKKNSNSMEFLINSYKKVSGKVIPQSFMFSSIESPKGEFGVSLVYDYSSYAYRCKIRSPGFTHLSGLKELSAQVFLADVVALIGSIDVVFGEIDR